MALPLPPAWRELARRRFPDLPSDCGNDDRPGIVNRADLLDWSRKATTPDQRRIERYIDRFDLRAKHVLHIGVGNSGLAKRFHRRVGSILGTTIDRRELAAASPLELPNYTVVHHNKYSTINRPSGPFDVIVDNNPTSFCCCLAHLAELFRFYDSTLTEGGQIVTDQEGLAWIADDSNPRWSFDFADLAAVASIHGLSAHRIDRNIYVLTRGDLPRPDSAALLRHKVRQAIAFPRRAAGIVVRAVQRNIRAFGRARN